MIDLVSYCGVQKYFWISSPAWGLYYVNRGKAYPWELKEDRLTPSGSQKGRYFFRVLVNGKWVTRTCRWDGYEWSGLNRREQKRIGNIAEFTFPEVRHGY